MLFRSDKSNPQSAFQRCEEPIRDSIKIRGPFCKTTRTIPSPSFLSPATVEIAAAANACRRPSAPLQTDRRPRSALPPSPPLRRRRSAAGTPQPCQIFCCRDLRPRRRISTAAVGGHREALYSLAVIQFNGSGGSKDDRDLRAGAALCARAASLGHVDALREIGRASCRERVYVLV